MSIQTEQDRARFEAFLLRHSGRREPDQCPEHPQIRSVTYARLREVMQEELGFAPTRQHISNVCKRLRIVRPQRRARTAEEKVATRRDRWQRYVQRLQQNPVKLAARLEQQRRPRWPLERRQADPEGYARYLEKRREYLKAHRRARRQAA